MFEQNCGQAIPCYDLVVFPQVSISIRGFQENYPEARAIAVNTAGAFDRFSDRLDDITFL